MLTLEFQHIVPFQWAFYQQNLGVFLLGTKIAAATSWSITPTESQAYVGKETWQQVFLSSHREAFVATWPKASNGNLEINRIASNMTDAAGMKKEYGGVSGTPAGIAFVPMRQGNGSDEIEQWQIEQDLVSWSSSGIVNVPP